MASALTVKGFAAVMLASILGWGALIVGAASIITKREQAYRAAYDAGSETKPAVAVVSACDPASCFGTKSEFQGILHWDYASLEFVQPFSKIDGCTAMGEWATGTAPRLKWDLNHVWLIDEPKEDVLVSCLGERGTEPLSEDIE